MIIIFLFTVNTVVSAILAKWNSASDFFSPPMITERKTIYSRVLQLLTKSEKCELNRGVKQSERDKFIKKQHDLFNILTCKCPIQKCHMYQCEKTGDIPAPSCGPYVKIHYDCTCSPEKKIPFHLLDFIRLVTFTGLSFEDNNGNVSCTNLRLADVQPQRSAAVGVRQEQLQEVRQLVPVWDLQEPDIHLRAGCLIRHVLFQFQLHFCIQSFYLGPDLHLSGRGHHILGTAPVRGGLTAHRGHQLHLAHPDGAGHSDHDHQDLAPHVPRPAPVCLVQVPKPNSKNTYFPILLLDVFQGAESEAGWRE